MTKQSYCHDIASQCLTFSALAGRKKFMLKVDKRYELINVLFRASTFFASKQPSVPN